MTSKSGGEGWFKTTEASHIAFCDMQDRIAYIARMDELKAWVSDAQDADRVKLNGCECILVNVNEYDGFQKMAI